jgi:DNA-binding MarR family transcriptional regulator
VLYHTCMETKEDFIKVMSRKLFRILNKHSRLEALPARFDEGVEVTHRELHAIQAIGENKRINITDLGACFGVTKSAASQMVSKLVKKGLVEKESSAHSNKELQLSLTDLGWRAFHFHERFHGDHMANLVDRLGAFSLSQIATTSVLLDVLESVVDERLSQRTQG